MVDLFSLSFSLPLKYVDWLSYWFIIIPCVMSGNSWSLRKKDSSHNEKKGKKEVHPICISIPCYITFKILWNTPTEGKYIQTISWDISKAEKALRPFILKFLAHRPEKAKGEFIRKSLFGFLYFHPYVSNLSRLYRCTCVRESKEINIKAYFYDESASGVIKCGF